MLSIEKNFLFIHVPKTGGNSIQTVLLPYAEETLIPHRFSTDGQDFQLKHPVYPTKKHHPLKGYLKILGPERFADLYKFAIIRNPWERLASHFLYRIQTFAIHPPFDRDRFIDFIDEKPTIDRYITLDRYIRRTANKKARSPNRLPQYKSITNFARRLSRRLGVKSQASNQLSTCIMPLDYDLDFLLRFEHLNEDFAKVCAAIDIPFTPLPHINKTNREHYTTYYDEEIVEIVRQRHWREIEFGGYQFGAT